MTAQTPPQKTPPQQTPLAQRIAGAPISWGVCEVPGWGYQLDVDRVLDEMRGVGLAATEFGPDGFLPVDPVLKAGAGVMVLAAATGLDGYDERPQLGEDEWKALFANLDREVPGRIVHTHLKDVDAGLASRVRAGELTYTDAVKAGMYRPLADVKASVAFLRSLG